MSEQRSDSVEPVPPGRSNPTAAGVRGLAIASLVLGILAVGYSIFLLGLVLGMIGFFLGVAYLSKKSGPSAAARWGVYLSLAGILASVFLGYRYLRFYQRFREAMRSQREAALVSFDEWTGKPAPDFIVNDLEGHSIKLSDLKGKRVILDFWATWCAPCRMEIPHFLELRRGIGEDQLAIIGISSEEPEKLSAFSREQKINYPLVSAPRLPEPYSRVVALPTTFFIDRNGVIQSVLIGYHSLDNLRRQATGPDYRAPGEKKDGEPAKME